MASTKNPDLVALRQIDGFDQQLVRLERDLADLPQELARYEGEVARLESDLEQVRVLQRHLQKEIDGYELDAKANNEQIGKYRGQQNTVKTNEEYTTLKNQITALEDQNAELEDKALENYLKLDEVKVKEKEAKAALDKAKEVFARERTDIEADMARLQAEIAGVRGERDRVLQDLNPDIHRLYERILEKSRGRALAVLNGAKCSGCHLDVPSGRVGAVHIGHDVVMCPQCSRILYID